VAAAAEVSNVRLKLELVWNLPWLEMTSTT